MNLPYVWIYNKIHIIINTGSIYDEINDISVIKNLPSYLQDPDIKRKINPKIAKKLKYDEGCILIGLAHLQLLQERKYIIGDYPNILSEMIYYIEDYDPLNIIGHRTVINTGISGNIALVFPNTSYWNNKFKSLPGDARSKKSPKMYIKNMTGLALSIGKLTYKFNNVLIGSSDHFGNHPIVTLCVLRMLKLSIDVSIINKND